MQVVQFSYTLRCVAACFCVAKREGRGKNNGRSHPCKQEKIQGKKSKDLGEEGAYKCNKLW